jgi:hypothetical protein
MVRRWKAPSTIVATSDARYFQSPARNLKPFLCGVPAYLLPRAAIGQAGLHSSSRIFVERKAAVERGRPRLNARKMIAAIGPVLPKHY